MSVRFPHSRRFRPPLPTLTVALRSPTDEGGRTEPLECLVDTGADITSIPIQYLNAINAPMLDEVRITSHWGHGAV